MNKFPKIKKSWRFWLLTITGAIAILFSVGWWFACNYIRSTIAEQLTALDLGEVDVGRATLSSDGVTASDIRIRMANGWLEVDQLNIQHPVSELIGGAEAFDAIILKGVRATIGADDFFASNEDEPFDFRQLNFRELQLPAQLIEISDAQIAVQQSGRDDLLIDGAWVTARAVNDEISILGEVADLASSTWAIEGKIQTEKNILQVKLESEQLKLATDEWSQLPLIPAGLENSVTVDGTISTDVAIRIDDQAGLVVQGSAAIGQIALNLPSFDVPIEVHSGQIAFDQSSVHFSEITAQTDDRGQLQIAGDANFDNWPIDIQIATAFSELSVGPLRKFVPAIPEILQTKADGKAAVTLQMENSLRTTVDIDSQAKFLAVEYGSLVGQSGQVDVTIRSLTFDQQLELESITGAITANAVFADQSLDDVFATFEVTPLQQQLAIGGSGSGNLELKLPLDTIDDLATWQATIDAESSEIVVAGERLRDVLAKIELDSGNLVVGTDQAFTVNELDPETDARVELQIDPNVHLQPDIAFQLHWPLVETAEANSGRIDLTTSGTDAKWIYRSINRLVLGEAASTTPLVSPSILGRMSGRVNSTTRLTIPTNTPEDFNQWQAAVEVTDSSLQFDDQRLEGLSTKIALQDSCLKINDLVANNKNGRSITGAGEINLNQPLDYHANVDAPSLAVDWITGFAAAYPSAESVEAYLKPLQGNLSASVSIVGPGSASRSSPVLNVDVHSSDLAFGNLGSAQLNFKASGDQRHLTVEKLRLQLDSGGQLEGDGQWQLDGSTGEGQIRWQALPVDQIVNAILDSPDSQVPGALDAAVAQPPQGSKLVESPTPWFGGQSSGELRVGNLLRLVEPSDGEPSDGGPSGGGSVDSLIAGEIRFSDLRMGDLKLETFGVRVETDPGGKHILLQQAVPGGQPTASNTMAKIEISEPYLFSCEGKLNRYALSRLFADRSVLDAADIDAIELTGTIDGEFRLTGQFAPLRWDTAGRLAIRNPSINLHPVSDVTCDWSYRSDDVNAAGFDVDAFGGSIEMVELKTNPQGVDRVRVRLSEIDAEQAAHLFDLPVKLTGRLTGEASLEGWDGSQPSAELQIKGSAVSIGPKKFGDFVTKLDYRDDRCAYQMDGSLLGGKLSAKGETPIDIRQIWNKKFPLDVQLANATLSGFYSGSNYFKSLQPLSGALGANATFEVSLNAPPTGRGRFTLDDVKWNRETLTRQASFQFSLDQEKLVFDDVKLDLKHGQILANVRLPLGSNASGQFQLEMRHLDLEQLAHVAKQDELELAGFLDARLTGRIGQEIKGRGFIGFDQASLHDVSGQSARLPVQFQLYPLTQRGQIELRRSKFSLFGGTVAGTALIDFGRRFDLDADLQFANVDTGKLIQSLTDSSNFDQGKLSGRLKVSGRNIRSEQNLKGTFDGELDRASVFQLPVLQQLGRLLAIGNASNQSFDSDEIQLTLNRGKIDIKQLNFQSALAKVAVTGFMFIDGRLNLDVAARVEQLNQPVLLDEILGSPLVRFSGSPAGFLARAAEFLSNRVAFFHVGGNVSRPQIRVNTGRQIGEEAVRFFLRGSNLFGDQLEDDP